MNKRDTYVAIALLIVTIGLFYGIFYFKNHYLEDRASLEGGIKSAQETSDNLTTQLTQQESIRRENEQLIKELAALPTYDNYTVPHYTGVGDRIPYPVPRYTDDGELLWIYYTSILYREFRPYSRNLSISFGEAEVNDRGEAIIPTTVQLTVKEADLFNMLDEIYNMQTLHRTINSDFSYSGIGPDPAAENSDEGDIESFVPLVRVNITTDFYCLYYQPDPNREYPYSITVEAPIDGMFERSTRGN